MTTVRKEPNTRPAAENASTRIGEMLADGLGRAGPVPARGVCQLTTSRMYTMSSSNRPSPTPGTLTGL